MKNLTRTICLTLTVLLGSTGPSWGADYDKAFAAYQSGDFATALQELIPLAEEGHVDAQFGLAWMYESGEGVPQDYKTAVKWYTLAAEQGDAGAQFYLGWLYFNGQGVPQNYETAVKWYTLAAEQGDARAQIGLGLMFSQGNGVMKEFVYAHMWGNIAASNGDENGSKLRDAVAKEMTAAQIEKAEQLARECIRKEYKGC